MKTTGVSDIPKFGLLDFLGHPIFILYNVHRRYTRTIEETNQPWKIRKFTKTGHVYKTKPSNAIALIECRASLKPKKTKSIKEGLFVQF